MSENKQPVAITDPAKQLDPSSQKAFQLAVDFYEADKDLTRADREILSRTYATISYSTLGVGWTSFFVTTSIPFYIQKLRTGSTKGTNVGLSIILGMAGMAIVSPYGSKVAYEHQLNKLRETNQNCYKAASILKPQESTKWMIYYNLTKDHPEHIMKDPRSQEAAVQRNKNIYSGRDPLGLYSGPRAEIARGPSNVPYPGEAQDTSPSITNTSSNTVEDIGNDDPFGNEDDESKRSNSAIRSAWQKVRAENGFKSDDNNGNSWSRIRQGSTTSYPTAYPNQNQNQNQSSFNNVYNPESTNSNQQDAQQFDDLSLSNDQSEFDKLLEQERLASAKELAENEKWR